MLNQRLMATAIIKKNGKYLVLRRSRKEKIWKGKWQFPEGGVEFGESPEKALEREIKEELKIKVKKLRLIGIDSCVVKKILHVIRIVYKVEVSGEIELSKAHDKYNWLTKEELKDIKFIDCIDESFIERFVK